MVMFSDYNLENVGAFAVSNMFTHHNNLGVGLYVVSVMVIYYNCINYICRQQHDYAPQQSKYVP